MPRALAEVFCLAVTFSLLLVVDLRAQGTPIGFAEEWALATDRSKALEQLIPGTRDFYYYQCRHRQDIGDYPAVEPLLRAWIQRHGRTQRVQKIENRQALLTFDRSPAETLRFLQRRLGLKFDHQRQMANAERDVPSALDPALVTASAYARRALQRRPNSVAGFRDTAFDALLAGGLDGDLLMSLLTRLQRPDVPNLPALVVRNLSHRRSRGFGSLGIHSRLLLDQLEQCVSARPALLNTPKFVATYLARLQPGADVRWAGDAAARQAYLERLQAFAQRLTPAHNSLKAHVLHHRLVFDLAAGKPDKARLMAYLRLPRPGNYSNPEYLRRHRRSGGMVDPNRRYATGLGPVGNDEPLVRRYLMHFFAREDSYQAYTEMVRGDYLRRLFAETKILAGIGDMERWYSLLDDPAYYERLKERVEIEFAPTLRRYYGAVEKVTLLLDVKNVKTLLIKVFEINTFNFYQKTGREVDASINLDGLVANQEMTREYTESPMRRVRRSFEFPALSRRGVYVVEFIGNGLSSRAVIHKGRLQYTERLGAAGHVLVVRDETGKPVMGASAWFGGRGYLADERGEIALPYSTQPGSRRLILTHGELSTLEHLYHRAESYQLSAGIYLDRESLLSRRQARVVVRPDLRLNGQPVSLELLEQPVLTIQSRDAEGVSSSLDVRGFKLHADQESVHEIQVPANLALITVTLSGRIRNLSQAKPVDLKTPTQSFELNSIDASEATACPLLGRTPRGYVLDVLGKNGEAKPQRPVRLTITHKDYTESFTVTLKTDADGRIRLGQLPGIQSVMASGLPRRVKSWRLRNSARTYPGELHGVAGKTLRLPYQPDVTPVQGRPMPELRVSRAMVSLLETRGGVLVRDAFEHVALAGGFLELRDLAPGDYSLLLKQAGQRVKVRVTRGRAVGAWAIGRDRMLEQSRQAPLHIASAAVDQEQLRVQLANAGPGTRVHVVATRYLTAYDPFAKLAVAGYGSRPSPGVVHPESSYHSGREIGDEYRYILDRRFATKYPGNMLKRPGVILNPWALDESAKTALGVGGGAGGRFGGRRTPGAGSPSRKAGGRGGRGGPTPGTYANLEFLPQPAQLLTNLRADQDGVVQVPLLKLGEGQLLHVLAIDGEDTVYQTLVRAEQPLQARGRQLRQALSAERHYAEQRKIEFVKAGGSAVLGDASSTQAQTYDSLRSVFQLFSTLSRNADLDTFAFVLDWPKLSDADKQQRYERHACHELHFFLQQKDPVFFAKVVRPYLANKAHKTFLDQWLLGAELRSYLEPWAFYRLNIAERALLARRLGESAPAIQRHIKELFELKPLDPAETARLFAGALKSRDLAGGKAQGLANKLDSLRQFQAHDKKNERAKRKGAPAPSASADGRPRARRSLKRSKEVASKALEKKVADMAAVAEESEMEERDAAPDSADKPGAPLRDGLALGLREDLKRRQQVRELYRAPDPTKPYVEHNYWHRRNTEHNAGLIKVNGFWRDFAVAPADQPFVSTHLAEATSSFAEMMLALSVLDLPFESQPHATELVGNRLTLEAASPLLLVRKERVEISRAAEQKAPILVSQNYFRLDERYRFEGNRRFDAYVTGEFLIDVAYGCRVVVTNPTSTPRELDLLLQIPQGAIPVKGGFYTKGVSVALQSYGTSSIEYAFYFPEDGTVPHYPVHVSSAGKLVAYATAGDLAVVRQASKVDTSSWQYVSQNADNAAVLAYLDSANLQRTDLAKIAWRMRDASFFSTVIGRLRGRHAYSDVLWSYGIRHADSASIREYLRHQDRFLQHCGQALSSTLVQIDSVERNTYQQVEYEPLFNARAHRFGKQRRILNSHLAGQYRNFLAVLGDRRALRDADWMSVTYYLLLQDRVGEALTSFARVRPSNLPMRVQYDYMQAYLSLFGDDHTVARRLASQYDKYPVARWRKLFREVGTQLDEAAGTAVARTDPDDRTKRQTALAAAEPSLELKVEAKQVTLNYRNVERCDVRYYEMDVEFLFSTHPFVQQGSGSFAYIKPNKRESRELPAGKTELAFDLPVQFRNSNVLIEVRAGGVVRRQAYYANSLAVQWTETYGQLRVAQRKSGKPLRTVYVKVFARMPGGRVRFYKDGYTDLRGRFDYASLSAVDTQRAERYSILVLSEKHGAMIREVAPPAQ